MLKIALTILFKLFFGMFSRLQASLEPELGVRKQGQSQVRAEVLARRVSQGLRQTLEIVENTLTQRIDAMAHAGTGEATVQPDTKEMDELHAQIAELKADLRILHRQMAKNGSQPPTVDEA